MTDGSLRKGTTAKIREEAVFKIADPCKGKPVYSCNPLYLTIWGKNNTSNTKCLGIKLFKHLIDFLKKILFRLEVWCLSIDQIKYRVTHSGVQCKALEAIPVNPVNVMKKTSTMIW